MLSLASGVGQRASLGLSHQPDWGRLSEPLWISNLGDPCLLLFVNHKVLPRTPFPNLKVKKKKTKNAGPQGLELHTFF